MTDQTARLLRDAENYLSALHGSVARHDNLAANYGCAGCELRDQIREAMAAPVSSAGPAAADRDTLRARLVSALDTAFQTFVSPLSDAGEGLELSEHLADAVLAVLPAPTDQTAVTCSVQHHRLDDGRLCIRAAQHSGDHIDERGYHWSDTVAVYPLADGQFRTGANVRDALRRMAGEAQHAQQAYPAYRKHATERTAT